MSTNSILSKIRQEIERRINILTNVYAEQVERKDEEMMNYYHGKVIALEELRPFLDTLSEEPDKSLEEAAWDCVLDSVDVNNPVLLPKYKELLTYLFIAGAEWQKEQDQPITGNSLEKEWLRYVDKKKKECGGELPALGEYGWLQIARHFAEWQKSQMPMPEDTVLFQKGVAEGRRLEREDMLKDAEECELYWDGDFLAIDLNMVALGYSEKDKVKVIVLKDESK